MWINRSEWFDLKKRVSDLESRQEKFTVYDHEQMSIAMRCGLGYRLDKQEIAVKTVVQSILDKLGMRLQYVKGQPARVDVVTPPDAAHGEQPKEPK